MQRLDNYICGIRKGDHSLEAHRAIWALAHMRHLGLSFKDAEKIRTFLKKRMAEGVVTEDVFGLNRVVLSLQACLLASSEIGLRGHALVACILRSLVFETTKLDEVEKVLVAMLELHYMLFCVSRICWIQRLKPWKQIVFAISLWPNVEICV